MDIKKGDVYLVNLEPVVGSEQGGKRPVVILQNDIGNQYSKTVIVAPITSKIKRGHMPTHIIVNLYRDGVVIANMVMLEQIRTIDKQRLIYQIGSLDEQEINAIDGAFLISLGIEEEQK